MLRFMANSADEIVEELKAENLELRLQAIKKELATFKIDMHRHLDLLINTTKDQLSIIIANTEKTNGSVARALTQIANLEREDNKTKLAKLELDFTEYKKLNKFWSLLSANRWVAIVIVASVYAFAISDIRDVLLSLFKIIG